MPTLETRRLLIRPFFMDDLQPIHRLLDVDLREAELLGDASGVTLEVEADISLVYLQKKDCLSICVKSAEKHILYHIRYRINQCMTPSGYL